MIGRQVNMNMMPQTGNSATASMGEAIQQHPYAPYGKACLSCVKSKTRCASSLTGGRCERCNRLNKDCEPAPSVRKKRVSKRTASSTSTYAKTAALEEKLDGIVQMLQRSQGSLTGLPQLQAVNKQQSPDPAPLSNGSLTSSLETPSTDYLPSGSENAHSDICFSRGFSTHDIPIAVEESFEAARQNGLHDCSRPAARQGLLQPSPNEPPTPAASSVCNSTGNQEQQSRQSSTSYPLETEAELEEYLETFRSKMVPYFPIICISPLVTIAEMRKERPFLLLVIRGICSKNLTRQTGLMTEVKKVLAKQMLSEGAKTLDMLLGVLVFAGWCHYWICSKSIISTVVQLGMSLAFDLGLTRPLPLEGNSVIRRYIAQGSLNPLNGTTAVRTIEERRTAVSLYLVSSVVANYFQRIELMRWTPYLEECLRILEEVKEYSTDQLLVYSVRVQLICNKASPTMWYEVLSDPGMRVPAGFYFKTLQMQLDDLERSLPQELKSNATLQLQILSATLEIHEYSLETTPKPTSTDPTASLQRIESLWICLQTVKSWFNLFFSFESFPLTAYPRISMTQFSQMAHCIVALYRLGTFEAPDIHWDRKRAREELDLGEVVKLMAGRWASVPAASGIEMGERSMDDNIDEQCSDNPWSHTRKKVMGIGKFWEAKVAAMAAAEAEKERGQAAAESEVLNVPADNQIEPLEFDAMDMDMLNENWVRDFLAGGYDSNLDSFI